MAAANPRVVCPVKTQCANTSSQWLKHPEPSSWISVLEHAQDGYFARSRVNPYGESWTGPDLAPYNHWPELV